MYYGSNVYISAWNGWEHYSAFAPCKPVLKGAVLKANYMSALKIRKLFMNVWYSILIAQMTLSVEFD